MGLTLKDEKMKQWIDNIEEYIIGIVLFIMLAIVFLNALSRYLINLNIASAMEIVTSLFPWLTFLGGAIVVKKKGHIGFSLLTDQFPEKIRRYVPLFSALCMILVFTVIAFLGMKMVLFEMETHQVTAALEFPTWVIELSIPLGSLAIIIRTIQTFFFIKAKPPAKKTEEEGALSEI
jgi:C4-dicarboxylate transporter, DctQ subunit